MKRTIKQGAGKGSKSIACVINLREVNIYLCASKSNWEPISKAKCKSSDKALLNNHGLEILNKSEQKKHNNTSNNASTKWTV